VPSYEKVYLHIPVIIAVIKQLEDIIAIIRQTAQQQVGIITQGFTVEKHTAVNRLTEQCMKVVNVLYVYAFRTENQQLLSKMSINKRMLFHRHDNEVLILAKNIAAEAAIHLSMLQDYGLDSSELDTLDGIIVTFENLINKPQITRGERKVQTGNLKQLFAEADSILYDQLDKLIAIFKTSEPDFYNLYKTARSVVYLGKRSGSKKDKDKGKGKGKEKEADTAIKVDTNTKPNTETKPEIKQETETKINIDTNVKKN
jgi:hypothetical protein